MDLPSCEECQAIIWELRELVEISGRSKPRASATLWELA